MRKRRNIAWAATAALASFNVNTYGAMGTWNVTTGGSWQNSANWVGGIIPNAIDDNAIINTNLAAAASITLDAPTVLGSLALGDSTTPFFGYTISSNTSANTLTFQTSTGLDAQLTRGTSLTTATDTISAVTILNSSLDANLNNSAGSLLMTGPISGAGGIVRKSAATGANTSIFSLENTSNSYTGATSIQDGILQFRGSVLSGQNSALGNSTGNILVGTAASSITANTPVELRLVASDDTTNYTVSRGLDLSGSASGGSTMNIRFNGDGAGVATTPNTNMLTLSGPIILNSNRNQAFVAASTGMQINITGLVTGGGSNTSSRQINLGENYGGPTVDGVGGNATYRFSNPNNSFGGNLQLNNGTLLIAGTVGAVGTNSPIGVGGNSNQIASTGSGSGNNAVGSYGGQTTGTSAASIRSVFMEQGGTSISRNIQLGGGRTTQVTAYGSGANINFINGYRFGQPATGAVNASSGVTWNGQIQTNSYQVGTANAGINYSGGNPVTVPGNIALIAATGGYVNFTGLIYEFGTPVVSTGATNSTGSTPATRITINQFRNNPALDGNQDGIPDSGLATGYNANEWIGTPTTGVVKLSTNDTWTGTTDIAGGSLLLESTTGGISAGGTVTVYPGATLGGFSTLGAGTTGSTVEVNNNAAIYPGDSTASSTTTASLLTIAKPINFNAGSVLQVDLNGSTLNTNTALTTASYGQLNATSATGVTLNATASLNPNLTFQPLDSTNFKVLSVPNGTLTGTFANLSAGTLSGSNYTVTGFKNVTVGGVPYTLGAYYQTTGLTLIAETKSTWLTDADSTYGTAANWDHGTPNDSQYFGGIYVTTKGASAVFGNVATAVRNISGVPLGTLDSLTFSDTNPNAGYNLSGSFLNIGVVNASAGVNTLACGVGVTNLNVYNSAQLTLTGGGGTNFGGTFNVSNSGILNIAGTLTGGSYIVNNNAALNLSSTATGTYGGGATVNGGTLTISNTTGSAIFGNVVLNGGVFASGPGAGGSINTQVSAGTGAHTIAPGGFLSIGNMSIGSLVSTSLTTINFDLGSGAGPIITNGDILTLGSGTSTIGTGTMLTFAGTSVAGNDYRLISYGSGLDLTTSPLSQFSLPTAPAGQTYSLSSSVDAGYIDLVVGSSGPANLTFNNAGGPGNGTSFDTTQLNFNNGSAVVAFSNGTGGAGDNVTFNDTNNGNYTVTISSVVTPSSTTISTTSLSGYTFNGSGGIGGTGGLTKSGVGALALNTSNSYTGATNISGGTVTLGIANALPKGTNLTVANGALLKANTLGAAVALQVGTLNVAGQLDLVNNDLVVHNPSSTTLLADVQTLVKNGFNNGAWNGNAAIISSAAASQTLTALGVILNDNGSGAPLYGGSSATIASTFAGSTPVLDDVLVKYTYYGDSNLDGKVDASDYARIDNAFVVGNLSGWYNGDFNYDGVVNGSDYTLIDNAYNTQGSQIAAVIATPTAQIAGGGSSAVPEPTTLSLLGITAAGLLGRRRRHAGC